MPQRDLDVLFSTSVWHSFEFNWPSKRAPMICDHCPSQLESNIYLGPLYLRTITGRLTELNSCLI